MKQSLSKQKVRDAIILAHWKAQSYKSEQYTDLWDFCDWLGRQCRGTKLEGACIQVREIVEGKSKTDSSRVVRDQNYYGPAFQHSHGLSIYFPWKISGSLQKYCDKSVFAKESGWGEFLLKYVEETEVEMRGQSRDGKRGDPRKSPELVQVSAVDVPIVIPVLPDFPGTRQPPGSDKQPPGSDKGLSKQGTMKNQPRYFLRDKNGEAVR
jgi:hypothetical protein